MGQQQNCGQSTLTDRFTLESEISETNCRVVRQKTTGEYYVVKQVSLTSTDQFNRTVANLASRKKLRNEHYFSLEQFLVKSETSFCSIFHKITTIYQYSQHTLHSEVQARSAENKAFEEKELWSILCSCCLAISYLIKNGVEYKMISTKEIFLTPEGIVKVSDPDMFMVGNFGKNFNQYYSPEYLTYHKLSPSSCVFSLAMCLLELMFLENLRECYDYQEYRFVDSVFTAKVGLMMKMDQYSESFKQVLLKMLNTSEKLRPTMTQLQQHLIQVVDTPGSGASQCPSANKNKPSTAIVQQKQQTDQPQIESQILSVPINPVSYETNEQTSETPEPLEIDLEAPDEADDAKSDQILTDRSREQHRSSECKNFNKEAVFEKCQHQNNVSTFEASINNINQNLGFGGKNRVLMPSYPDNINSISISVDKKSSFIKQNIVTVQQTRHDTEELFTKPEILAMVRQQLEEINMRKSKLRPSYEPPATTLPSYQPPKVFAAISQPSLPKTSSINIQRPEKQNYNMSSAAYFTHSIETSHARPQQQPQVFILPPPILAPSTPLTYVTQTYTKGKYQGQKKGNLRHGYGTFHYKQGGKYTGEWVDNKMSGKGILYYFNDKIAYDGEWKDDRLWGHGVLYNQDPKTLKYSYNYASWDDVDEYWVRYEGGFIDDNKDGKGKLFLSNGEVFEGTFKNDQVNGEGIFYRSDGKVIRGMWRGNQLVQQY